MMWLAPSDLRSFSATFSYFNVSLSVRAIPMHSPPSGPKSLLLTDRDSKTLFLISKAEMHTAPWTPRVFFLEDPSIDPKSKCFKFLFCIKSSRKSSRPCPDSCVDAKFNAFRLRVGSRIILLRALVAIYAFRLLSAKFKRSI